MTTRLEEVAQYWDQGVYNVQQYTGSSLVYFSSSRRKIDGFLQLMNLATALTDDTTVFMATSVKPEQQLLSCGLIAEDKLEDCLAGEGRPLIAYAPMVVDNRGLLSCQLEPLTNPALRVATLINSGAYENKEPPSVVAASDVRWNTPDGLPLLKAGSKEVVIDNAVSLLAGRSGEVIDFTLESGLAMFFPQLGIEFVVNLITHLGIEALTPDEVSKLSTQAKRHILASGGFDALTLWKMEKLVEVNHLPADELPLSVITDVDLTSKGAPPATLLFLAALEEPKPDVVGGPTVEVGFLGTMLDVTDHLPHVQVGFQEVGDLPVLRVEVGGEPGIPGESLAPDTYRGLLQCLEQTNSLPPESRIYNAVNHAVFFT